MALPYSIAQSHAEEVCRRSGAWAARRAGKRLVVVQLQKLSLLDFCKQICINFGGIDYGNSMAAGQKKDSEIYLSLIHI